MVWEETQGWAACLPESLSPVRYSLGAPSGLDRDINSPWGSHLPSRTFPRGPRGQPEGEPGQDLIHSLLCWGQMLEIPLDLPTSQVGKVRTTWPVPLRLEKMSKAQE